MLDIFILCLAMAANNVEHLALDPEIESLNPALVNTEKKWPRRKFPERPTAYHNW
jgi:hypothetical protein